MPKCSYIDSLVTPYVDGELAPADHTAVDEHVAKCPPCRGRLLAERAVRGVLAAKRAVMCSEHAPAALRARCQDLQRQAAAERAEDAGLPSPPGFAVTAKAGWRSRLAP